MADSQVPGSPGDTGVQRALGERRRRRVAERTGQVDLDATMSQWPVTEPPSSPRPVVRPARPSVAGVATGPVLPTPGAMVVGPLLEARSAAAPRGRRDGSRRSRRVDAGGPVGTVAGTSVTGPVLSDGGSAPVATGPDPDDTPTGPQPTVPASQAPMSPARTPVAPVSTPAAGSITPARQPSRTPSPRPSPASSRTPRALLSEVQGRPDGLLRRLGSRRLLVLAAAALLVVLLVVLLLVVLRPGEDPAQAVEPVPEVPAQQTVALALDRPAGGGLVGAALVGVDSAEVSTLLLPADLLLTVADAATASLTEAASLGSEPVRRGLEDTLLVRVDGVVVLAPGQLASLVDAVGGVVVDVTSEVVTDSVLVAVGDDQRLAGAQAVAYASLVVDGEPAEAGLARFGAVVQALLAALPAEADAAGAALEAAGLTSAEGLSPDELADVLAAAADRAAAGNVEQVVLPTEEIVAGGAARRGVDDAAAGPELDARFAGALLPVAAVGEVRVLVRNAVGRPGLGAAARDLLVADGLRFVGSGNAPTFGQQPETAVLVPSQGDDDRDRGEAVAAALGLDEGALQVNSETLVDTDVVVVLGDDFARAVAEQTTDAGTAPGTPTSGEAP